MNWSLVPAKYAAQTPDKECLVCAERRLSWTDLRARAEALAGVLSHLGVEPGDRVAILLFNCLEYVEITFAVNQVGAVWLPLNFRLAGPELHYILDHAGARVLISEADFAGTIEKIRPDLPLLEEVLYIGGEVPGGGGDYEALLQAKMGNPMAHAQVDLDDLHRLMYTSGTTARPKGVMLTYGNLYWKNLAHTLHFNLTADDRTLVAGPLYHVGGMDLPASGTLYIGGSLVILKKFEPKAVLQAIQQERVSNLWLAPAMINAILQEPGLGDYDLSSVRFIIDGGEKMPLPLIEKVGQTFPRAWFADAYGLTETVSGDTFLAKDRMFSKLGSVGKPVIQLRVRVVDEQDRDVAPGELGEILLRGPKVFKGYWQDPEATAAALRGGWFHTGDIGRLDEEGYLYIEDRKKDMIISGGENIASPEVERILYQHPAVLEAAVVGIPHAKWQEVPKAFVVLRPGEQVSAQQLQEHCAAHLAKFKVPAEIEFLEQLPRNPSGKVLKRKLRGL